MPLISLGPRSEPASLRHDPDRDDIDPWPEKEDADDDLRWKRHSTRRDAEVARDKLCDAKIDKSDTRILDQSSAEATSADPFRERSIEMTATEEEAVVGKETRVIEEVGLTKTSEDRVEDIRANVRKTKVVEERIRDRGAAPPQ